MSNAWRVFFVGVALVLVAVAAALIIVTATRESEEGDAEDLRQAEAEDAEPSLKGRPGVPEIEAPEPSGPSEVSPKGWVLTGRVHNDGGAGIEGALVIVRLDTGTESTLLTPGRSGPDGRYEVDISSAGALSRAVRAGSWFKARAGRTGFKPGGWHTVEPLAVDVADAAPLEQDFELTRGAAVVGCVVDEHGRSVEDADAVLVDGAGKHAGRSSVDADGLFTLGVTEAGTYRVWATSGTRGVGSSAPLETNASDPVDVGDVVLSMTPTIEGVVKHADGAPLPGVQLYAQLREASSDPYPGLQANVVNNQVPTETDEHGRFRVLTWRPGRYAISLSRDYTGVKSVVASSGDRDVEIVVDAHRLVVRVVDEAGALVAGGTQVLKGWMPGSLDKFERVARGEFAPDELWSLADTTMAGDNAYAGGRLDVLVPPGSAWLVEFAIEGLLPIERLIRIPREGRETRIDLVARLERPMGELALEVLDERGDPITPLSYALTTPYGGDLAAGIVAAGDPPVSIPAGDGRLRIWPGPADSRFMRDHRVQSAFFALDLKVEIRPGETTRVTARARRGGYVRLHLELPSDAAIGALKNERVHARLTSPPDAEWSNCWMYLYDDGEELMGRSWFHVTREDRKLSVRIARLFEPGRTEIKLRVDGYKEALRTVDVLAGEEAELRIVLEPE